MKSFKQTYILCEANDDSKLNGFVILKPEFLDHEEDFYTLLKNNGWDIIQKVKRTLSKEEAEELYKRHKEKPFYNDLCKYMSSGDCICCICHKDCKDPIKDMDAIKDKVRKIWGKDKMRNGMHSSDSLDNVNRESKLIFEKKLIESMGDISAEEWVVMHPEDAEHIKFWKLDEQQPSELSKKIKELQLGFTEQEFSLFTNMLRDALSEELLAWYHYTIVWPFLQGKMRPDIVKFFQETAKDELEDHAYWLMERLNQFGVTPEDVADPVNLNNIATHKYIYPQYTSVEALLNNIEAEKGAIETYDKLEKFTRDKDQVSNSKIKEILADEQEHLAELQDLLTDIETL